MSSALLSGSNMDQLRGGSNFIANEAPGCHVVWPGCDWILASGTLDDLLGDGDEDDETAGGHTSTQLPDISVDPDEHVLTLINSSKDLFRAISVTVYQAGAKDKDDNSLACGSARDAEGNKKMCITFLALLRPEEFIDVCQLQLGEPGLDALQLESDVQDIKPHDAHKLAHFAGQPTDEQGAAAASVVDTEEATESQQQQPPRQIGFPMSSKTGPFCCSQGMGGQLTHFFPGTLHAVDLACPVGTELLAVGDGVVLKVSDSQTVGGIAVSNLFSWNSLLVRLNNLALDSTSGGDCFVEYVHIEPGSCIVAVGDRVRKGQLLCKSGDVGFCPRPHLHLQVHAASDDGAPTVPWEFDGGGGFKAVAGGWYTAEGPINAPSECGLCEPSPEGAS